MRFVPHRILPGPETGKLRFDPAPEHLQKLAQPCGIGGPCRGRDQFTVHAGLIDGDIHEGAPGQGHVQTTGRVGGAASPLEHIGGGQHLGAVTDRGNGFVGGKKMPDDFQNPCIRPDILGRPATGYHQRIIAIFIDHIEGSIERKVVSRFLAVRLITLKIVHRRAHRLAFLFVRAHGMHVVPTASRVWKGTITS